MTLANIGFEEVVGGGVYATLANVDFEGFARGGTSVRDPGKSGFYVFTRVAV